VAVAGHDQVLACELALDTQRVVDHRLAAEREEREVAAEPDGLHGVRRLAHGPASS